MTAETRGFCRTWVAVWEAADPRGTFEGPEYDAERQSCNGRELSAFVDVLAEESRRARRLRARSEAAERRVLEAFGRLAGRALGWERGSIEQLLDDGFREALRAFPQNARRFDPSLTPADIYQAARNALTMHCLQRLLGVAVEPTPSVLGYSLLYPYTDNLLDDPGLDRASKVGFGQRLGRRLRGQRVDPAERREECIFQLVEMIESQYSRRRFPQVFDSLIAIHEAQVRSLALLGGRTRPDPATLIGIAAEKGGTSVLADGYLVAGTLTPSQAECIFGLGVFLQLRDDLEDILADRAVDLATVFSAHEAECLDDPTARALAIGAEVLARLGCFDSAGAAPVRRIMAQSLPHTIGDAAASFPSLYSDAYLRALERRSPFRFEHLATERRRLSRATGSLTGLLERWIEEPAA